MEQRRCSLESKSEKRSLEREFCYFLIRKNLEYTNLVCPFFSLPRLSRDMSGPMSVCHLVCGRFGQFPLCVIQVFSVLRRGSQVRTCPLRRWELFPGDPLFQVRFKGQWFTCDFLGVLGVGTTGDFSSGSISHVEKLFPTIAPLISCSDI